MGLGVTWENNKLQSCSENKAKAVFCRKDGSDSEMCNKESAFSLQRSIFLPKQVNIRRFFFISSGGFLLKKEKVNW